MSDPTVGRVRRIPFPRFKREGAGHLCEANRVEVRLSVLSNAQTSASIVIAVYLHLLN